MRSLDPDSSSEGNHARKTAAFFLRRFYFHSSWFTKSIYIIESVCLSIYMYDSLRNSFIKKILCETQLRFEGQKSALACAQNFHWWTFLTRTKQVLNSQPNYWHQGLFKNCKLKENMHSDIVIKSQTIIKMMVFEKQYHTLCQSSSSPIALFLLRGGDRPPCPYCFLASGWVWLSKNLFKPWA